MSTDDSKLEHLVRAHSEALNGLNLSRRTAGLHQVPATRDMLDLIALAYPHMVTIATDAYPPDAHLATQARIWCFEARKILDTTFGPTPHTEE